MIAYVIKHHAPGRIRIEIPELKKMDMPELQRLARVITPRWKIVGIRDISARPLTGCMTITYDPAVLDIAVYLAEMAADEEINALIEKGVTHEMQ